MTPDEPTTDERLASLLAACDEALATGALPTLDMSQPLPADLQTRLERDLGCLQLLEQFWPRSPAAPVAGPATLGRFVIRRELGRGGFGVVFLAHDPQLRREVALKVPRTEALVAGDLRERFLREARAAAGLNHPNLVPVYEVGEVGALCYIASAYCPGPDLAAWLKARTEPVPFRDAAQLLATLAGAVQHAHDRGIVHRDLKPANILLMASPKCEIRNPKRIPITQEDNPKPDGGEVSDFGISDFGVVSDFGFRISDFALSEVAPKVTDFGLAKLIEEVDGAPTQSGVIVGTPHYMAPEQASGKSREVGPPADVYALGSILYEALTGQPPFAGESTLDILLQVRTAAPRPPSRLRPRLPRDLETICLKCLEKEPGRRYVCARDLADDLARFLSDEPIRARPIPWWGRGLRWVRRHPARALTALLVVLALTGAVAGYWLWHQREEQRRLAEKVRRRDREREQAEAEARTLKVRHFAHFINRRGEMEGLGPLTEEQARGRNPAYRFFLRGGRVERVDVVNGLGRPTGSPAVVAFLDRPDPVATPGQRACSYRFERDQTGRLTRETAHDPQGRLVWTLTYTSPTIAHYTDPRGFPTARAGSGAAYVELVWSPAGSIQEMWYLDAADRRRPDQNGVHGERWEHDARGRLRRLTYLNRQGRPARSRQRTAGFVVRYDDRNNCVEQAHFGRDERPARHRDGYHKWTARYDARGHPVERAYFGVDGRPALKDGAHRWTARYDGDGNLVEKAYFGITGRPARHRDGYHKWTALYDDRGNRIEWRYFGTAGTPGRHKDGYHRASSSYDLQDNRIGEAYFDDRDRPARHQDGHHSWRARHDARGYETERAFFGSDGAPVLTRFGFHKTTARHDERGNLVETAYFDTQGHPTSHVNGCHRVTTRHDDRGNPVEVAYFNLEGRPALLQGFHRWRARYDESGRRVEETFFGARDKPVSRRGGYHKLTTRYDDRGNVVEVAYFDGHGRPVAGKDGYARLSRVYDDQDAVIDVAAFDARNQPVTLQVVLTQVAPGGQAWRGGLRAGDILLSYDGQPVTNSARFNQLRAAGRKDREPRTVEFLRGGAKRTMTIAPGRFGATLLNRAAGTGGQ